jgi:serine/threonine-protein kinase
MPDGPASDVYALGAIAFWLFSGKRPFEAPTLRELLLELLNESPPPLRSLAPHAPAAVETAVARALAKKPEDRFPSVADFARALG